MFCLFVCFFLFGGYFSCFCLVFDKENKIKKRGIGKRERERERETKMETMTESKHECGEKGVLQEREREREREKERERERALQVVKQTATRQTLSSPFHSDSRGAPYSWSYGYSHFVPQRERGAACRDSLSSFQSRRREKEKKNR